MPPVPVPRTWTAGETVTAASMNSLRDQLAWLLAPPYFHGYQIASQTVADITAAPITMTGELVDTLGGHSTGTNTSRYTPNVPGKYRCIGQVSFVPNANGQRVAEFRKNGTAVAGSPYGAFPGAGGSFAATCAHAFATITCNGTTDYIELWGNQNSGAALGTDVGGSASMMIIEWIGS